MQQLPIDLSVEMIHYLQEQFLLDVVEIPQGKGQNNSENKVININIYGKLKKLMSSPKLNYLLWKRKLQHKWRKNKNGGLCASLMSKLLIVWVYN